MVAGQSNAEGGGTKLNYYLYQGTPLGLFKRPSTDWANLQDPTSDVYNNAGGSVWPLVGQYFFTARSASVGFVTTAVGATTTQNWLPGTSAYDAMVARANLAVATAGGGTLKAVVWWQGESDAINGVSQATYHANLATIAAQIGIDLGVPMIVAKLQACSGCGGSLAGIQAAQVAAWSDIANVRQGPDLSDLVADDGLHLTSNANVQTAGARWWAAIQAAIYP